MNVILERKAPYIKPYNRLYHIGIIYIVLYIVSYHIGIIYIVLYQCIDDNNNHNKPYINYSNVSTFHISR